MRRLGPGEVWGTSKGRNTRARRRRTKSSSDEDSISALRQIRRIALLYDDVTTVPPEFANGRAIELYQARLDELKTYLASATLASLQDVFVVVGKWREDEQQAC
jgi:hypothetical protein